MTVGETFPAGVPYVPPPSTGAAAAPSAATGDRPSIAYAPAKAVNGQLVATLGPPSAGKAWSVSRITVTATDASGPSCYVYVGATQDQNLGNLVFGTASGGLDCADNSPVFVPEGASLQAAWTTGAGSAGLRIEYVEL